MFNFRRMLQRVRSGGGAPVVEETEVANSFTPSRNRAKDTSSNRQLIDGENLPLSILPEPDLYIETAAAPFERLRTLVDVSDGGVLAVTGERGAGKSMLLRKTVDHYAANFDVAQNVVIHLASPVSSAREMDFFIMLFRHLTVNIKNILLEKSLHSGNDIESIGREAMNNIRHRSFLISVGIFLIFLATSIFFLMPAVQHGQISQLEQELESAQSRKIEDDPRLARAMIELNEAQDNASKAGNSTNKEQLFQISEKKKLAAQVRDFVNSEKINRIKTIENLIKIKKITNEQTIQYASMAFFVICIIIIMSVSINSYQRRRFWGLNVLEQGLLIYSERIERRLDFETTKGDERSLEINPVGWFKAGGKMSSSDKARALSLPELTTNYIEYIKQIRRIFSGKIVACVDELDKITDIDQVRFILREIKGALYVKGSYYILSVSTDGLRSFEGRLADGRDIFESTFDDALSIRSLNIESCRAILQARLEKLFSNSDDDSTRRIVTIISVLSGGNTRELIRTFREWVLLERQSARPVSAREVWQMFLTRRIQAMIDRLSGSMASPAAADFTVLLEAIMSEPLALYVHLERLARLGATDAMASRDETQAPNDDTPRRIARYIMELRILILANIELIDRDQPVASDSFTLQADRLIAAYQKVPFNIRSADEELRAMRGHGKIGWQANDAVKLAEQRLTEAFSHNS